MKDRVLDNNVLLKLVLFCGLFLPAFIQVLVDLGPHKQLIIGSIINTCLFLSGMYEKNLKKIVALSTLPSISSMLSGILFSGLTFYTKLMIPFIWIGNFAIIFLPRLLRKKINYFPSCLISIFAKVIVIYGGFNIMNLLFNFPNAVLNVMSVSMGITQLYTAFIGFIVSFIIINIRKTGQIE